MRARVKRIFSIDRQRQARRWRSAGVHAQFFVFLSGKQVAGVVRGAWAREKRVHAFSLIPIPRVRFSRVFFSSVSSARPFARV